MSDLRHNGSPPGWESPPPLAQNRSGVSIRPRLFRIIFCPSTMLLSGADKPAAKLASS